MATTDYRDLLKKYMRIVVEETDGTDFSPFHNKDGLDDAEIKALREISDEVYTEENS